MKKIVLSFAVFYLFSACAASQTITDDALVSHIANELSIAQASMASLQSDLDALTLKNESMNAELLQNTETISELQANVSYLINEFTIVKKPKQTSASQSTSSSGADASSDKTTRIVIIEDSQAMKDSLYSYALQLYQDGKHNESIEKFQEFLSQMPNDALSNNAQYWIGENYYSMRDFQKALTAFQAVQTKYPKSKKVPDAILKAGFTYYELRNVAKAKESLNSVIKNYPESSAAKLAKQTLAKWK
ncbi:MAG: tol-pal system protein YbgF [Deferribacteraceae bacterium]|jgi:tol-pal system protein YbgF|nr:tol-pal system protein YbgF [Deferribacteraceae bacterium]